jgi:predicted lipoprotein with Yx(FWY)xxD motif
MSRTGALTTLAAISAIALSACSSGGQAPTAAPAPVSAPAPVTALQRPPGTIVSANSTAKLGTVVVDGLGFTLYRFDGDSARPPASRCEGPCVAAWEPVIATEPMTIEGIDEEKVGTVQRSDGQVQLTIGGWPVYRHTGDGPGATDGHGADGKWFAVAPDGDKAAAP